MKLKQFLKAANGRICGGSEYQWDCYGPAAQFMDVMDLSGNEVGGCVFDRETQQVYQVEVYAYPDDVAYRWIDSDYLGAYRSEAESRNVDAEVAYDSTYFTDMPSEYILHLLTEMVHCTYVHSKPIKPEMSAGCRVDQTLNPVAAWPFPPMGSQKYVGEANFDTDPPTTEEMESSLSNEYNNDEGMCGAFDVDEFRAMAGVDESDSEQKEYEVVLTVKHRFTVKARNMEAAGDTAKRFQADMKSGSWEDGLCWEDRWVSKVAVAKRLETVSIEE